VNTEYGALHWKQWGAFFSYDSNPVYTFGRSRLRICIHFKTSCESLCIHSDSMIHMADHKPTNIRIREGLQEGQPDNIRVTGIHLTTTVYERKSGVMRRIGWRLTYRLIEYRFSHGETEVAGTKTVDSVYLI